MAIKQALLAATILALSTVASAQPVTGLYVGAGGLGNILQNETVSRFTARGTIPPNTLGRGSNPKFDVGYGGLASIGYGFGNGMRVEIEGNYRANDLRSVSSGTAALRPRGHEEKYGAMVNALYDFSFDDIGLSSLGLDIVNPYVGVGVGYAQDRYRGVNIPLNTGVGYSSVNVNNGYDTFAAQAIAGVSVPLYDYVPGLSLTVDYRFYILPEDRKFRAQLIAPGAGSSASSLKIADNLNHSVVVGFRYAFDVPPPPAPPTPAPVEAPAPTRTYLVFFDWDRVDLTSRAKQIVAEAAQNSSRVQYTKIEVDGHADRSGSAGYNQKLSLRRANAVSAELVRDGVPQNAIDVQAFGDTKPLVPTAAGVREPQNRRVEIIIK